MAPLGRRTRRQVCAVRSCGIFGVPRPQIARRADHHIAPGTTQRQGDHIGGNEIFAAHAKIEAARHDVDQTPLRDDVDVDLGVKALERQDERGRRQLRRGWIPMHARIPRRS